jgi:hypothetical protein
MARWTRGEAEVEALVAAGELQKLTGEAANRQRLLQKAAVTLETARTAVDRDADSAFAGALGSPLGTLACKSSPTSINQVMPSLGLAFGGRMLLGGRARTSFAHGGPRRRAAVAPQSSSGPRDGPATNRDVGSASTSSSSTTSSLRPGRSTGPGTKRVRCGPRRQ